MKKSNTPLLIFILLAASVLIYYACQKNVKSSASAEAITLQTNSVAASVVEASRLADCCGQLQTEMLVAGQNTPVGIIEIDNDANNIYVRYTTSGYWKLSEVNINTVCNNGPCSELNNNMTPDEFPYGHTFHLSFKGSAGCNVNELPSIATLAIPISVFADCKCFCIYAHAKIARCTTNGNAEMQSAWGGTIYKSDNTKWYGVTSYCWQDCNIDKR